MIGFNFISKRRQWCVCLVFLLSTQLLANDVTTAKKKARVAGLRFYSCAGAIAATTYALSFFGLLGNTRTPQAASPILAAEADEKWVGSSVFGNSTTVSFRAEDAQQKPAEIALLGGYPMHRMLARTINAFIEKETGEKPKHDPSHVLVVVEGLKFARSAQDAALADVWVIGEKFQFQLKEKISLKRLENGEPITLEFQPPRQEARGFDVSGSATIVLRYSRDLGVITLDEMSARIKLAYGNIKVEDSGVIKNLVAKRADMPERPQVYVPGY